jgi:HK97 family phage portal protein
MVNIKPSKRLNLPVLASGKAVVQSGGAQLVTNSYTVPQAKVASISRDSSTGSAWNQSSFDFHWSEYACLYRDQQAVRSAVGFIARNIAQIGIHVFERVNDTDRKRLVSHPLALLLNRPLPKEYKVTTYRLIHDMMSDMLVFDVALWLKVKVTDQNGAQVPGGLQRIPPWMFRPIGTDWTKPEGFRIQGTTGWFEVGNDDVVYFHGYSTYSLREGTSPLETLRSILEEDAEGGKYRKQMWASGSRLSGYIQRPVEAPRWGPGARTRFREDWDAQYRGDAAAYSNTPILEDGMSYLAAGVTPQQAMYIEGRELTRSEVASAYFIQPVMLGIPGSAGFSSIQEFHKMLYQDTLAPILESVSQELELQLLTDWEEEIDTKIYVEFNINEKLKGSFEEQASQMSTLVGRPVMTANEGRARINLPSLPEGEGLVTPLNVSIGGQPNPQTPLSEPNATGERPAEAPAVGAEPPTDAPQVAGEPGKYRPGLSLKALTPPAATDKLEAVLVAFFERQEKAIVAKVGAGKARGVLTKDAIDSLFNLERWSSELASDMFGPMINIAAKAASVALIASDLDPEDYDSDRTIEWMLKHASGVSSGINGQTRFDLLKAITEADNPLEAVLHLFDVAKKSRAAWNAKDSATALSGFGTLEAFRQKGKKGKKTWVTTSEKPRSSHKALNGTTIPFEEKFVNGGRWPGDTMIRDIKERARCSCDLIIEMEK